MLQSITMFSTCRSESENKKKLEKNERYYAIEGNVLQKHLKSGTIKN